MTLLDDAYQVRMDTFYSTVVFTLQYYDYFTTISDEVNLFWLAQPNLGSRLFLFIRYLSILGNIPMLLQSHPFRSETICFGLQTYNAIFSAILLAFIGILLALRVYGLCGCSKKVLVTMGIIAAGSVCVTFWALSERPEQYSNGSGVFETSEDLSLRGCDVGIPQSFGPRYAAAFGGQLAFDSLLFSLTLYRSWKLTKGGESRLVSVMLRDGIIYYAVLAAITVSNIVTLMVAPALLKGVSLNFGNIMSVTILSHMMFHIHRMAKSITVGSHSLSLSRIASPTFHATAPEIVIIEMIADES